MISLFTGAPGAGKTAAMVDILVQNLSDRPLYVHGLDGLTIPHFPLANPSDWMSEVPDGAVIVIDEVQSLWRPRGPGSKVPDHIAALETHRHRGLDFYLTTQGPHLLDSNVRSVVGRHVHIRDLGILGRWWYEWPECADNCRTGFRNAPLKRRYSLPRRVYGLYKSASLHTKPIRGFPTALLVAVLALAATAYLGWTAYQSIVGKINPPASSVARDGPIPSYPPARVSASREAASVSAGGAPPPLAADLSGLPPPLPPAVGVQARFSGCAALRDRCTCLDTSGAPVPVDPALCSSLQSSRPPADVPAFVQEFGSSGVIDRSWRF